MIQISSSHLAHSPPTALVVSEPPPPSWHPAIITTKAAKGVFQIGPDFRVIFPILSIGLFVLPGAKLPEEAVRNSILVVALEPALCKAVVLHLALKKSVHPLALEPGAVHLRPGQHAHTVEDPIFELALIKQEIIDKGEIVPT